MDTSSFSHVRALPGSNGSNFYASLRSSQANVPRTFCDVSCSFYIKRRYPLDTSFFRTFRFCRAQMVRSLGSIPIVAGERLVLYFFTGYAMHSSGKNSLAVGLSPYKIVKINVLASKLAGRYFRYFAWLVVFTNFSQKISTQLLTWLIISVILQTEQRKKKRNHKGYKKSRRFPESF